MCFSLNLCLIIGGGGVYKIYTIHCNSKLDLIITLHISRNSFKQVPNPYSLPDTVNWSQIWGGDWEVGVGVTCFFFSFSFSDGPDFRDSTGTSAFEFTIV